MFCPKCGSNQGESKKFCTVCGTNLMIVSQALTGQLAPPPVSYIPPVAVSHEIERQQEMRKGITLAILGGGYIAYKLVSFILSAPFGGWHSPFGFLSFIAFIMFAVGASKIVSSRVTTSPPPLSSNGLAAGQMPRAALNQTKDPLPQPVFSANSLVEPSAPRTSELEPVRRPSISVTEDDTKHLSR